MTEFKADDAAWEEEQSFAVHAVDQDGKQHKVPWPLAGRRPKCICPTCGKEAVLDPAMVAIIGGVLKGVSLTVRCSSGNVYHNVSHVISAYLYNDHPIQMVNL